MNMASSFHVLGSSLLDSPMSVMINIAGLSLMQNTRVIKTEKFLNDIFSHHHDISSTTMNGRAFVDIVYLLPELEL
jgi:hypothetical protein